MSAISKPRLVAKSAPIHKPVTLEQAARLYPDSAELQRKWLAAIEWLRTRSRCGWVLDAGSTPRFRSDQA